MRTTIISYHEYLIKVLENKIYDSQTIEGEREFMIEVVIFLEHSLEGIKNGDINITSNIE